MATYEVLSGQLQSKLDHLRCPHPQIDKGRFQQGAISDEMWVKFEQLVQLCHAYRHWQQVSLKKRFASPLVIEQTSKHSRKKRYNEWKKEIHQSERHMFDAARLAAGKIADMSLLMTDLDPHDEPDWKLYSTLRLAVAPFPKRERGRFRAAAFRAFDADCELQGKPEEIASRWLRHAGYDGANAIARSSLCWPPGTSLPASALSPA